MPSLRVNPCKYPDKLYLSRKWKDCTTWCWKPHDRIFICLDKKSECDGMTDGQHKRSTLRTMRTRCKNPGLVIFYNIQPGNGAGNENRTAAAMMVSPFQSCRVWRMDTQCCMPLPASTACYLQYKRHLIVLICSRKAGCADFTFSDPQTDRVMIQHVSILCSPITRATCNKQ